MYEQVFQAPPRKADSRCYDGFYLSSLPGFTATTVDPRFCDRYLEITGSNLPSDAAMLATNLTIERLVISIPAGSANALAAGKMDKYPPLRFLNDLSADERAMQ